MPAFPPPIRLSHVTLRYEHDLQALSDLSLEIPEGQRLCILGANGSGKSTLASVLAGLLAPDEGTVELVGEHAFENGKVDFDAYRRARRQIGLVFQNPADQIVTTVVEDDVAFGPENLGVEPEEIERRVRRELRRVALESYAKADPTRLSGGQQQRVAIASALAMEPRVLVFDEPGALLDVRGRRSIMKVMDELKEAGTTLIHITHFMEEALSADRVIVLSSGRIMLDGTPEEVFSHEQEISSLGLEEPFAGRLSELLRARGAGIAWTCSEERLEDELARRLGTHMPASAACPVHPAQPAQPARPILQADHVFFRYQDRASGVHPALDDVSLSAAAGESFALVGQTGSGKSTLARLICALDAPDAGDIRLFGTSTKDRKTRRTLHGRIGYVMQHPERQLFAQTVAEDVAFGPRNMKLAEGEVRRRVSETLRICGLAGKEDISPFELSGGQKRLCAVAGVLAMEPEILVLDEPTAGLDPKGRQELRQVLDAVHAAGTTIIQVTHSMDDAARTDKVIVLDQSKVLMAGAPEDIFCPRTAELLHERGLGLPEPLSFALGLSRRMGLASDGQAGTAIGCPLTIEELADTLVRLLGRGQA